MEMPRPGAAHARLHVLVGAWKGAEKMHPSPWDPHGGMADAEIHNRLVLDGFAVAQDYAQRRGGQVRFRGLGVMHYDAHAREYQMHWWDSMGTPANLFRGQFAGDVLTLTGENPTHRSRAIFDLTHTGAGRYLFRMEISPDGEQWFPFMEGDYHRG